MNDASKFQCSFHLHMHLARTMAVRSIGTRPRDAVRRPQSESIDARATGNRLPEREASPALVI